MVQWKRGAAPRRPKVIWNGSDRMAPGSPAPPEGYPPVTGSLAVTHVRQGFQRGELCGMKRIDLLYWAVTGLLSVQLLAAVAMYFTDPAIRAGFAHLGFPDYFRVELGIAKGLGAVAILLPLVPL